MKIVSLYPSNDVYQVVSEDEQTVYFQGTLEECEQYKQSVQEYEQQGLEKYAHELETRATKEVPTAKKYISKNLTDFWEGGKAQYTEEDVEQAMIEFAKLHVEAALKAAVDNVEINDFDVDGSYSPDIDEESILNSYPLENIK